LPFTPFHLGPGALVKGLAGDHFSFLVFGGAQVLMDIEPGIRRLMGSAMHHGPAHTLLGASVIGAIAAISGKPISELCLRWLNVTHRPLTWRASAVGAFVGTYSHVLLDAVVHSDLTPFAPWSSANPLFGVVSVSCVYVSCVVSGLVGAALVVARRRFRKRSAEG
jgi:membrane-bound metal-dependent hydrolase YbcI (DUF457 family)